MPRIEDGEALQICCGAVLPPEPGQGLRDPRDRRRGPASERLIPALTYVLILKTEGRIYGLDLGKDHHNPQCDPVGETHKHRWSETFRDKEAHVPKDITAPPSEPVAVWRQFCAEAELKHEGKMHHPPAMQGELFL